MHTRPAPTTGSVARATFRGALGFTIGGAAFILFCLAVLAALAIGAVILIAVILQHLPADSVPPPNW